MAVPHLFCLPTEVLQLIAWHMDAGTFFVTLLTCKKFRVLAIDSRHNILHHLNTLPGNNFGLENLSTIDLLLVLRRRAAQNLRAAEALADVRSYIPSQPQDCVSNQSNGQRVIFSRNSEASRRCSSQTKIYSIGNAVFSMSSFPLLALVDENEVVNIYNLAAHRITLVSQLWHVSLDNVEKSDLVVLKMAFSHNQDLAVLYKKRRYLPDPEDQKLFPLKERRQPPPVLKLVVFKSMKGARETILHSRFFQETRNFPFLRGEPVGLAIAPDRRVCVAWKSSYESSRTTLWVVGRDAQLMQVHHYEPRPRIHLVRDPFDDSDRFNKKERLMFDINFTRNGEILNCYQAGHPVHKWFLDPMDAGTPDAGPFRENRALIDIHGRGTYDLYAVGMPFWGIHGFNGAYPVFGCRSTFYAIGVRQAAANFNVMIVSSKGPVSFGHCNHQLDLEEGRMSSTWMPLVQLSGWQRVDSTQGTVMAISPQGTRIATANWDCVLVWTLNPTLLHRQGLKRSLPTRDYDPRKGIGRLRPSKLPTVGVVYRMMWTSEESLYATTEYGLVQWNLGVWGSKRREKISMDHVPCPEPANT